MGNCSSHFVLGTPELSNTDFAARGEFSGVFRWSDMLRGCTLVMVTATACATGLYFKMSPKRKRP